MSRFDGHSRVVRHLSVNRVAAAAGILCLLVFLRSLDCDFVNFDDYESILENRAIRGIDFNLLVSSFSTSMFGFWMPLTWISYAIDYSLWGVNPAGYHLTNILLHSANAGLVVLIADRVMRQGQGSRVKGQGEESKDEGQGSRGKETEGRGWEYPATLLLAGLLWGIHPLRVESVTWVTERKDVLNGLFALSSVLAYFRYAEKRDSGESAWAYYLVSFVLFACSLMAKPVTVVLPVMLLVLDRYPLMRMRRETISLLMLEKVPFLTISAGVSVLTLFTAVERDALITIERLSVGERFLVAGNAAFEYLKLFVLPFGILPLHPLPHPFPPSYYVTAVLSLAVLCLCMYISRRSAGLAALCMLLLLPLLPVIGFLQNGQQAFAARYTYLPHIPLAIAAAFVIYAAVRKRGRMIVMAVSAVFLILLAGITRFQIGVWKNSATLWTRVIERHPVSTAFKSRGSYFLLNGHYAGAVTDYTRAMETAVGQEKLEIYNLLAGRAMALGSLGRFDESIRDFTMAIELYPHPAYYYSRGITYEAMGRRDEAHADLKRAGPDPGVITWFEYRKRNDR